VLAEVGLADSFWNRCDVLRFCPNRRTNQDRLRTFSGAS
jgi:hypothetical protein